MKLDKKSYIIYAELQLLIIKIDECESNLQKLSIRKLGENISSGYSMSTIQAFDHIEKKYTLYRQEDCMKRFSTSLRVHDTNILNFEKKQMLPLTKYTKIQQILTFLEIES